MLFKYIPQCFDRVRYSVDHNLIKTLLKCFQKLLGIECYPLTSKLDAHIHHFHIILKLISLRSECEGVINIVTRLSCVDLES